MPKRCLAILGILTALLWLGAAPAPARAEAPLPRFEPAACRFAMPAGERMECGYLVVPENRAAPHGRAIRVSVTLVKSHSAAPAPDPIIYLNGGPGGRSKEIIAQLRQYEAWLARRDLILFDQRGVGWSQPALDCPELKSVWLQEATGAKLTREARLAPALTCRERWLKQGLDLSAYNSTETAADVADLGQVLGYEQVNLFGISYGTLPAQLVMRNHGATGQIRSVILDSPLPLAVPVEAETPARLAAAMAQLFDQCQAELLCRAAYPDLEKIYPQLIERLSRAPATLSATDPLTGRPFSFQFKAADLGGLLIYGRYRTFPGLIYDLDEGDYTAAIEAQEWFIRNINRAGGDNFGLRTTIRCNEPWHAISAEQRAAMSGYLEAVFMTDPPDTAPCEIWPAAPPADMTPAGGDIPTLILAGEYDLRLAPYGPTIAATLRHGFH